MRITEDSHAHEHGFAKIHGLDDVERDRRNAKAIAERLGIRITEIKVEHNGHAGVLFVFDPTP